MSDKRLTTSESLTERDLSGAQALFADAYGAVATLGGEIINEIREHPVECATLAAGAAAVAFAAYRGRIPVSVGESLGLSAAVKVEAPLATSLSSSIANRELLPLSMSFVDSRALTIGSSLLTGAGALALTGCERPGKVEVYKMIDGNGHEVPQKVIEEFATNNFVDLLTADGPSGKLIQIAAGPEGHVTAESLKIARGKAAMLRLTDKQISAIDQLIQDWNVNHTLQNLKARTTESVFRPINPLAGLDPMNPMKGLVGYNSTETKVQDYITEKSISEGLERLKSGTKPL
ncbi:MAG: hypothetical protein K2W95_14065 [Candidatus Obscuribacterales bacterium]|nr:hypothetical protein [Candidatus Obscuribacterales bacterium]